MNAKTLTIASAFVAFMMVAGPAGAQNATPDAAAPAATAPADAAAPRHPPLRQRRSGRRTSTRRRPRLKTPTAWGRW